jgi:hypothetical protein
LPRVLHLPALPAIEARVSSRLASLSLAGREIPGCPGGSPHQLRLRWVPRLPRVPHLPVCQRENLRVAPHPLALWLRRWMIFRVASNHASLSGAGVESPGYPESSCPPALPSMRFRVAPTPASTTGSMMNPRLASNFASSACAADESSRPSESCTSLP